MAKDSRLDWPPTTSRTHRLRKGDIDAIATLDKAIGVLKKALARDTRKQGTHNWASRLQHVTQCQPILSNGEYLGGDAPNNVSNIEDLMYHLQTDNQAFTHHNQERAERRATKLDEAGDFVPWRAHEDNSPEALSPDSRQPCAR